MQQTPATVSATVIGSNFFTRFLVANDERSHAGPVASGCNRDAIPALADAFC